MKNYLCKFVPPRHNFLATMSDNEKRWMGEHGVYLNERLAEGLCIAHGPVIEGEGGGYGVSLWQIPDDGDIATLTSQDPIVANGVGHYEHFHMPSLKFRTG